MVVVGFCIIIDWGLPCPFCSLVCHLSDRYGLNVNANAVSDLILSWFRNVPSNVPLCVGSTLTWRGGCQWLRCLSSTAHVSRPIAFCGPLKTASLEGGNDFPRISNLNTVLMTHFICLWFRVQFVILVWIILLSNDAGCLNVYHKQIIFIFTIHCLHWNFTNYGTLLT